MDVLVPQDENSWEIGAYDIKAPIAERSRPVQPEEIDVVLVPCVGFDRKGGRMGHGAGYYDRYLPKCTKATAVLVAFDAQELDGLEQEPTDYKIYTVVTESGIIRTGE